ncbi:MAG: glycosyltransferase [Acidimicrobiia bacterium]|nr:glycosyltransferase [Acidimicrobiia bacterium]
MDASQPEPQRPQRRPNVALVGTAPPRRCGIATFTDDLRTALADLEPPTPVVQAALTDGGSAYDYGLDVVFEVQASQLSDYRAAADYIEQSDVDVVCVQHEFGIFGGPAGRHVTELLDHVRCPVVTTLHTVLAEPSAKERESLLAVAERSDRLVVLSEQAVALLEDGYGIDRDQIVVIPHGVPDVALVDPDDAKPAIGAEGRLVLMTFGLLGPDKGIEVALEALPAVVARHPELLYVVLGASHPEIRRHHGEAYRQSLLDRVSELGLEGNVVFHDRYVDLDELCGFLAATDLYLTPYRGAEQIVSGTLAYAVGMGRGVVSTPYRYARELLADGRGRLVPFDDPAALGGTLVELLDDPAARARMRRAAYDHARAMTWPAVAAAYTDLFAEVVATHDARRSPVLPECLPAPSFEYLRAITDDTGPFQHAAHGVVDRAYGYCTDDVGRALVVAVLGRARRDDATAASLVPTYLSFLRSAQRPDGRFANLMTYDRRFVEGTESDDTLGQAVWGLGTVIGASSDEGWRALAGELLGRALPALDELTGTKAIAYAICGLHGHLERFPGALPTRRALVRLAERLAARLAEHRHAGWDWFDGELTYGNAKVPSALLLAGKVLDRDDWRRAGLTTLDFLLATTYVDDRFDFVGNAGWYPQGHRKAVFGQQPIEAGYTAEACMLAYELTGTPRYLDLARAAGEWLLGRNRLGEALYDPATGRCVDGLDRNGVSANAGAESVVCALLGLLSVPIAEPSALLTDGALEAGAD